jgi:hypothetical protein
MKRVKLPLVLCGLLLSISAAQGEVLNVQQVKKLLESGQQGEVAAIAYVQGVMDGMLAMEHLNRTKSMSSREFCKLIDAEVSGRPLPHPAFKTKEIIAAWEREGRPTTTIIPEVVLSYFDKQFGCAE